MVLLPPDGGLEERFMAGAMVDTVGVKVSVLQKMRICS